MSGRTPLPLPVPLLLPLLLVPACGPPADAGNGPVPLDDAPVAVARLPLTDGRCPEGLPPDLASPSRTGLPAEVTALAVRLRQGDFEEVRRGLPARRPREEGFLALGGVPAGEVSVELFGCGEDGQPLWAGMAPRVRVEENRKSFPNLFLTPIGRLACPGSGRSVAGRLLGRDAMQVPRAFPTATPIDLPPGIGGPDRHGWLLVAGGLTTWTKPGLAAGVVATATATADLYDVGSAIFRRTRSDMRCARAFHLALPVLEEGSDGALRRKVLVVGGVPAVEVATAGHDDLYGLIFQPSPSAARTGEPAGGNCDEPEEFDPLEAVFTPTELPDPPAAFLQAGAVGTTVDGHTVLAIAGGAVRPPGEGRWTATRGLYLYDTTGQRRLHPRITLRASRIGHTVTALPDGRFLVWGGNVDPEAPDVAGEVVDPASGTVLPLRHADLGAPLPEGYVRNQAGEPSSTAFHQATVLDAAEDRIRVLVTGGLRIDGGRVQTLANANVGSPVGSVFVLVLDGQGQGRAEPLVLEPGLDAGDFSRAYHLSVPSGDGSILLAGGITGENALRPASRPVVVTAGSPPAARPAAALRGDPTHEDTHPLTVLGMAAAQAGDHTLVLLGGLQRNPDFDPRDALSQPVRPAGRAILFRPPLPTDLETCR